MAPCRGKTLLFRSSQQLPRLRLGPAQKGCQLKPFKSPRLASCVASGTLEIQGYRARREGPGTLPRTIDAKLDCALVENSLLFVVPKIGRL